VTLVRPKGLSYFSGKCCEICGLPYRKGLRFINHHITYSPAVLAVLCAKCHLGWHMAGPVWKHPFIVEDGKDFGALRFHAACIKLWEEKCL
jgi:hypothetical protein